MSDSSTTGKEVKNILKKYIQPNTAIAVRNTAFSFSLDFTPGLYFGREKINDTDATTAEINLTNDALGINGTLGPTLSLGKIKIWDKNFSLGVHGSVFDLGGILRYRVNGESDDNEGPIEDISLAQLFAPGIYGYVGFPNTGLALKVGWQKNPKLYKIQDGMGIDREFDSSLFSVGLCYQMTIFRAGSRK